MNANGSVYDGCEIAFICGARISSPAQTESRVTLSFTLGLFLTIANSFFKLSSHKFRLSQPARGVMSSTDLVSGQNLLYSHIRMRPAPSAQQILLSSA